MPNPGKTIHIRYACWGLLPAHVRKLRPHWTEQQALDWLAKHQTTIAKIMERIGWEELAALLDDEEDDSDE